MKIETTRLILFPASEKQMQALIAAQTNDALKAAYTEMLDGAMRHPALWEWYAVWMIERKDGTHVGELCFKGLKEDGSAEIGYGIGQAHRRRGYAAEAVNAVSEWALSQAGVFRIEAETEESNVASVKVLEKCGFSRTGITGEEGPRFARAQKKIAEKWQTS